jgi:hypothetical protein
MKKLSTYYHPTPIYKLPRLIFLKKRSNLYHAYTSSTLHPTLQTPLKNFHLLLSAYLKK